MGFTCLFWSGECSEWEGVMVSWRSTCGACLVYIWVPFCQNMDNPSSCSIQSPKNSSPVSACFIQNCVIPLNFAWYSVFIKQEAPVIVIGWRCVVFSWIMGWGGNCYMLPITSPSTQCRMLPPGGSDVSFSALVSCVPFLRWGAVFCTLTRTCLAPQQCWANPPQQQGPIFRSDF